MLIESNSKYYFINNSGAKKLGLFSVKREVSQDFLFFFNLLTRLPMALRRSRGCCRLHRLECSSA